MKVLAAHVFSYHDATKHDFNRFAASLGYLDWATQPDPFRRFAGAPVRPLPRTPVAGGVTYGALYADAVAAAPVDESTLGELLRCSMGLSAWKQYRASRWALRVNPSSGNLHPTETYVVHDGRVLHYAPREHACEERARLDPDACAAFAAGAPGLLVGLTSIHWREAWKYGERAFRYCQHDAGHALAALRLAAALLGWRMAILPRWSSDDIAGLLGLERDVDFDGVEREEPDLLAVVTPGDPVPWVEADPAPLVTAARAAGWRGRANRLSASHVEWPAIDTVAEATRYPGVNLQLPTPKTQALRTPDAQALPTPDVDPSSVELAARAVILQRRSAVAFDARTSLSREAFLAMLARLRPGAPPWDSIHWPPQVHLALFVHRVDGLTPGVYVYTRDERAAAELKAAMRPEFMWEPAGDPHGALFLLLPTDVTWVANRLSCDQDIAADGFFSLAMVAKFDASLRHYGEWFYRRLFWECGMVGQVLYLEAEAAGGRATGIGCFYDDRVHEALGLSSHAWQSLYHFSMGVPVDDERLTTEPGYEWERA